jgi:hypothetical protein
MVKSRSVVIVLIGTVIIFAAVGQVAAQARPTAADTVRAVDQVEVINEAVPAKPVAVEPIPAEQPADAVIPDGGVDQPTALDPLPPMTVIAEAADGYIVFVEDAGSVIAGASAWPQVKLEALVEFYEQAVLAYTGETGFGTVEVWAAALNISRENPLRVVYAGNHGDPVPARAGWRDGTAIITHYTLRTAVSTKGIQLVLHEMAHIWDGAHGWELGEAILSEVQNPRGFPTVKARDEGPKEDFAESVTALLWPGYAVNRAWSDDEPGASEGPDATWTLDRHDYVEALLQAGM